MNGAQLTSSLRLWRNHLKILLQNLDYSRCFLNGRGKRIRQHGKLNTYENRVSLVLIPEILRVDRHVDLETGGRTTKGGQYETPQ
jgi:hypothetical protein